MLLAERRARYGHHGQIDALWLKPVPVLSEGGAGPQLARGWNAPRREGRASPHQRIAHFLSHRASELLGRREEAFLHEIDGYERLPPPAERGAWNGSGETPVQSAAREKGLPKPGRRAPPRRSYDPSCVKWQNATTCKFFAGTPVSICRPRQGALRRRPIQRSPPGTLKSVDTASAAHTPVHSVKAVRSQ